MADPLRLVFMGSDPVGLPLLDWIVGEGRTVARLVGIVTGPDRASGRGQAVAPNAVGAWTSERLIMVLKPEKLDAAAHSALSALRPDVVVVVAYGHILRDDFISIPRLGTLNLHASLLPKYRGASPIQSAVACGDCETGMTLMRIVRALDAGPVAGMQRVALSPLDTALDVEGRLAAAAISLMADALPLLARGELSFVPQDDALASYCRRLSKADGVLDFAAPAARLAARVNGLHPWPSVAVELSGVSVKLGLADAVEGTAEGSPGTVAGVDSEGLRVTTGSGILRLRRLQRPGGRMLPAPEFVRGFPIPAGTVILSQPMPELVSPAPFGR